jgi:hypothetical protein
MVTRAIRCRFMEQNKVTAGKDMTMPNWKRTLTKHRRQAAEMRANGWTCVEPLNADDGPPMRVLLAEAQDPQV